MIPRIEVSWMKPVVGNYSFQDSIRRKLGETESDIVKIQIG